MTTRNPAGIPPKDEPKLGMPEALLSVDDLARILRVPKATIYRWRSTGDGPRGYSIGRYVRFRWPDVEAWLNERADDAEPDGAPEKMS